MKKHKFTCVFILVFTGMVFVCGAVLAAWNVSEYAENLISMSSYKNSIQEKYIKPNHVDPGQKVIKEVFIKNEGTEDSFVRVKVGCIFGSLDRSGNFREEQELDPKMIEIHYNTDLWKLKDDGYWYYKEVLPAGESTRKPLMDHYYLSEKAHNGYKNKEARIVINLESIQAKNSEMELIWGISEKDLGITYQPCTCETVTSVIFDKAHRLKIGGEAKDLFANFKNLTPGCARSQTIRITNSSELPVKMYLHAEAARQKKMSQENLALVNKLLSRYAIIEIRQGDKVLYQGTADGNMTGSGWSMKDSISLGDFAVGEGKNLIVKLSLSEEMDNQYQELLGKVNWVFSVYGTDEDNKDNPGEKNHKTSDKSEGGTSVEKQLYTSAAASPKTGDETRIFFKWLVLFGALAAMLVSSWKLYRKEKQGD